MLLNSTGALARSNYKNLLVPFFIALSIGLLLVWISQALRLLQFVLNNSGAFTGYMKMTLLSLGLSLNIIPPLAAFIATVYFFTESHNNGSRAVVACSGINPVQSSFPVIIFGLLIGLFVTINALFIAPYTERQLRIVGTKISSDFLSSILQEGTFNSPQKGVTIFIGDKKKNGLMTDIVINDARDSSATRTYSAKRGYLLDDSSSNSTLVLSDGKIISFGKNGKHAYFLNFLNYSINLSEFVKHQNSDGFVPREFTNTQLLSPQSAYWQKPEPSSRLVAEFFHRLSVGLYAPALIAIACMVFAHTSAPRQPIAPKILLATFLVVLTRLIGISINNNMLTSGSNFTLSIIFPLGVFLFACAYIIGISAKNISPADNKYDLNYINK